MDTDKQRALVLKTKESFPRHYPKILKTRHTELWNQIENFCLSLPSLSSAQKVFHWLNNLKEIPLCPVTGLPLKFQNHEFAYRQFGKRGIFTKEFTKRRAEKRKKFTKISERIPQKLDVFHFDEEDRKEIISFLEGFLKLHNNVGALVTNIKTTKNLKTLAFLQQTFPTTKNTSEQIYLLLHGMSDAPLCPFSGLTLPFKGFNRGYTSSHPSSRHLLKKQNKEKLFSLSKKLSKRETIKELNNLLEELEQKGLGRNNFKQSAFKKNPSLVISVEWHTKDFKTLTNKWSERAYLLLHQSPIKLNKKRFSSFEDGYYETFIDPNSSKGETEIYQWLKETTTLNIQRHTRVLNGMEIDIFIPEKSFGIEYHGEYYHNFEFKGKQYHKQKADYALQNNINLIQVFESEWFHKKEIIKSIICSKLGLIKTRLHARECIVKIIVKEQKNQFLKENHIQGEDKSEISLGLFKENVLVACMTFGRSYNKKKDSIELVRFCNKLNTMVIGGASKLLSFYIKNFNPHKIHTYADRRFANSSSFYETLGFNRVGQTEPNYFYFKSAMPQYVKLQHRFNFAKHMLKHKLRTFDPKLTEYQNMKQNRYLKIYDAGSFKYELVL